MKNTKKEQIRTWIIKIIALLIVIGLILTGFIAVLWK